MAITVSNPSYDAVYTAYAWRDNNRTLKLVQGEGITIPTGSTSVQATRAKAPRFQLRDDHEIINLSSGITSIHWAVKRPRNAGEDLVVCNVVTGQAANGIIEIPIPTSVTEFAGEAHGEIRLNTSSGVIKFYGINACIGEGVSDAAAAHSSRFDALTDALNQVVELYDASGTAKMDALESGNLPNGTNPVSSGNLKTYLEGHYVKFGTIYASELNNADTHLDPQTIYRYGAQGLILAANDTDEETQYYLAQDGSMRYRYRKKVNGEWEAWDSQFIKIETTGNKVTEMSNSSTDEQYPTAKAVYDAITGCEQYRNPGDSYINNSDNHLENNTVYKYGTGFLLQASSSNSETQYYFASDGKLRFRTRSKTGDTWDNWVSQFNFSVLETQDNKTTTINSSSTDAQYPTAKAVYDSTVKFATITSTELFDADTHLDPQTIYRYGAQGTIIAATNGSNKETQYYFAEDGVMRYRYRVKSNGEWQEWVDGNNFYAIINQENIGKNLNPYLSPQNKLDKYFVKTCIDKTKVKLTPRTRILGFGDSIMNRGYGGSWMDVVKDRVGCYAPINKSVGGAQFANNGNNILSAQLTSFHNSVNNNTLSDADGNSANISEINLIVVAGGTNDAYNGTPINTFKTAVDSFFASLVSEFTDRELACPPILVITPIRRGKETEINAATDNNLEVKIAKYGAVINNSALQSGFSVLNGFDIPVLVDDMVIESSSSATATISSFMYKTADSGDTYDDILHVHPNPTTGRSTYAQAVIAAIGFTVPTETSVFNCTLNKNSWIGTEGEKHQSVSVPSGYVAYMDTVANISVGTTGYNQMLMDGCTGIAVAATRIGSTLSLVAYAYGHTPTENIDAQISLVPVTDINT